MGTANFVVNGANLEATLKTVLFEIPNSSVLAPGLKSVSVVLNGLNSSVYNVGAISNGALTVTREDARVNFTGTQLVATESSGSGQAYVTLRASVQDITATPDAGTDTDFGNISKAKVRFSWALSGGYTNIIDIPGGTDANGWIPVSLIDPSDIKNGVVQLTWPVDIGVATSEEYSIRMEVDGYYTELDYTTVTVYKPVGDFITGGGNVIPSQSAGQYASDPGKRTNFGFNVKYNKSGKSLKGNMNIIFRRTVGGVLRTYQIKGNAMQSLGVNIANPNAKTAVFVTKANLTDITDPLSTISLGGNLTLQVNMTDRGEPGENDDIAITLWNGNSLLYSSNWINNNTNLMLLAGGNLVVHSGFNVNARPGSGTEEVEYPLVTDLTIRVLGNPSPSYFMMVPESLSKSTIEMKVFDANGRLMELRRGIHAGEFVQIGDKYTNGIYMAEFTQDGIRKTVRLVKQ
jgi:hypothetical protein